MLFHVRMEVSLPHDMAAEAVERLRASEREVAQDIQRRGKWPHLWRIAGRFANISVFDCADADELHALISSLPMFPYMDVVVTPLARHPSKL